MCILHHSQIYSRVFSPLPIKSPSATNSNTSFVSHSANQFECPLSPIAELQSCHPPCSAARKLYCPISCDSSPNIRRRAPDRRNSWTSLRWGGLRRRKGSQVGLRQERKSLSRHSPKVSLWKTQIPPKMGVKRAWISQRGEGRSHRFRNQNDRYSLKLRHSS